MPERTLRLFCSCKSGKGGLSQGRRERRGKAKDNDWVAGVCRQITKRLFNALRQAQGRQAGKRKTGKEIVIASCQLGEAISGLVAQKLGF